MGGEGGLRLLDEGCLGADGRSDILLLTAASTSLWCIGYRLIGAPEDVDGLVATWTRKQRGTADHEKAVRDSKDARQACRMQKALVASVQSDLDAAGLATTIAR